MAEQVWHPSRGERRSVDFSTQPLVVTVEVRVRPDLRSRHPKCPPIATVARTGAPYATGLTEPPVSALDHIAAAVPEVRDAIEVGAELRGRVGDRAARREGEAPRVIDRQGIWTC